MKKLTTLVLFLASLTSLNATDISELPEAKIISTQECNGVNLHVNFKTDSSQIKKSSYARIKEFADYMISHPDKTATIAGHTDSVGNAQYNQALSQRRAKAVYEALINYGVDADRLDYVGYGESDPIATNKTAAGRAANRRIEAILN
jgi:OOP family OmpA-OmpF porin